MKAILLALAVVVLISEVHGFFEIDFGIGPGNRGQGGSSQATQARNFGRPATGGHHNMFPKCKNFMQDVHNKLKETGSGPLTCRDAHDEDECKFQETMKARMAVRYHPSEECLDQIHNFLSGTPTAGSSSGHSGGSSSW